MKVLPILIGFLFILSICSSSFAISYEDAMKKMEEKKSAYQNAYQEYLKAREQYMKSKINTNRLLAINKTKAFLSAALDRMISNIEVIRSRVESSNVLSEEEKLAIISELNAILEELNSVKSKIDSAASLSDLRNISIGMKRDWVEAHKQIRAAVGLYEILFLQKLINKEFSIADKIDAKIAELKANGTNTSVLEVLASQYRDNLASADVLLTAARVQFNLLKNATPEEKASIVEKMHNYIINALEYLKSAHAVLREIRSPFKTE